MHRGANRGFSILLKNTVTCGPEQIRIETPTFRLVDDLICHLSDSRYSISLQLKCSFRAACNLSVWLMDITCTHTDLII